MGELIHLTKEQCRDLDPELFKTVMRSPGRILKVKANLGKVKGVWILQLEPVGKMLLRDEKSSGGLEEANIW